MRRMVCGGVDLSLAWPTSQCYAEGLCFVCLCVAACFAGRLESGDFGVRLSASVRLVSGMICGDVLRWLVGDHGQLSHLHAVLASIRTGVGYERAVTGVCYLNPDGNV